MPIRMARYSLSPRRACAGRTAMQRRQSCLLYTSCILQAFIRRPEEVARGLDFDRKLYIARRLFEQSCDNIYVPSLSSRTIAVSYTHLTLGEHVASAYIEGKTQEWDAYRTNVSQWELENYLARY